MPEDTWTSNLSLSQDWDEEGARIDAQKAQTPDWAQDTPERKWQIARKAVITLPVDITEDGEYPVRTGPVEASFWPDRTPLGLRPPPDAAFRVFPQGVHVVTDEATGQPVLQLTLIAQGVKHPYRSYRLWLY